MRYDRREFDKGHGSELRRRDVISHVRHQLELRIDLAEEAHEGRHHAAGIAPFHLWQGTKGNPTDLSMGHFHPTKRRMHIPNAPLVHHT